MQHLQSFIGIHKRLQMIRIRWSFLFISLRSMVNGHHLSEDMNIWWRGISPGACTALVACMGGGGWNWAQPFAKKCGRDPVKQHIWDYQGVLGPICYTNNADTILYQPSKHTIWIFPRSLCTLQSAVCNTKTWHGWTGIRFVTVYP